MKQTHVYEVRDVSDDEIYFVLGMFLTQGEAIRWVRHQAADVDKDITQYGHDYGREIITVNEIPVGPGDYNKIVFTLKRVMSYDEENDVYLWENEK